MLLTRMFLIVSLLFLTNCTENDFVPYTPKPYFSEQYKNEYRGQISFEMNNLVILTQAILSYTSNPRIIKTNDYYKVLDTHLNDYKYHPVVSLYKSLKGFDAYIQNTTGSFGYTLNEDNSISEYTSHKFNNLPNTKLNDFLARKDVVEDFAKEVDYYSFWLSLSSINNDIISSYKELIDIEDMKLWLESRFESKFDSYRIIISPLSRAHNVIYNRTKDYNELVAFINPPSIDSTLNQLINSGFATRIIFTEIDHPYVDHFSNNYYESKINRIFRDIDKWGNGAFSDYSPGAEIFSEYMTWTVFCMYAKDTYPDNIAQELIEAVNITMESGRRFRLFRKFTDELFKEFSSYEDMHLIYEHMLSWADAQ